MYLKNDISLQTLSFMMNCPDTYLPFIDFFEDQVWKIVLKKKN